MTYADIVMASVHAVEVLPQQHILFYMQCAPKQGASHYSHPEC